MPLDDRLARELFDLPSLVETLDPKNVGKLLVTWQARRRALDFFDTCKDARRVSFVVVRAESDERWLIPIGRSGGYRKEWNFGTGR